MTNLERLQRARADIETVLTSLEKNLEPVTCVGQGRLEAALLILTEATALLDGHGAPELDIETKE